MESLILARVDIVVIAIAAARSHACIGKARRRGGGHARRHLCIGRLSGTRRKLEHGVCSLDGRAGVIDVQLPASQHGPIRAGSTMDIDIPAFTGIQSRKAKGGIDITITIRGDDPNVHVTRLAAYIRVKRYLVLRISSKPAERNLQLIILVQEVSRDELR